MTTRHDAWIHEDPSDDGNNPPPERPPSYDRSRLPAYLPPGRVQGNVAFGIGSMGWRAGRVQPLAPRSPLDFDISHAVFHQARFEVTPIPSHAMGVAYVNYRDSTWMLARRFGHYDVAYRSVHAPHVKLPPTRLSHFANEAVARVGTHRWNSSRWFYFYWDVAQYGDNGDLIL